MSSAYLHSIFIGALPQIKKDVEQVEKSFSEMKGDVGMSLHEKKGNKKMPRQRQEIIYNPIPTSLFSNGVATHLQVFLRLHPQ